MAGQSTQVCLERYSPACVLLRVLSCVDPVVFMSSRAVAVESRATAISVARVVRTVCVAKRFGVQLSPPIWHHVLVTRVHSRRPAATGAILEALDLREAAIARTVCLRVRDQSRVTINTCAHTPRKRRHYPSLAVAARVTTRLDY